MPQLNKGGKFVFGLSVNAEQHHNLDYIIKKKADAAADFLANIKTTGCYQAVNKPFQPIHSENFILKEIPYGFHFFITPPFIDIDIEMYKYIILNYCRRINHGIQTIYFHKNNHFHSYRE